MTQQHARLTCPLVRDSRDEPLRHAGWKEALDRSARGPERHRDAYGLLSGDRETNETHYLAQKFARVVMAAGTASTYVRRGRCRSGRSSPLRKAGARDEAKQTRTDTVCARCGVGCELTLHVQDNDIVKVTSPRDGGATRGSLCIKGRSGHQHVQNRD